MALVSLACARRCTARAPPAGRTHLSIAKVTSGALGFELRGDGAEHDRHFLVSRVFCQAHSIGQLRSGRTPFQERGGGLS